MPVRAITFDFWCTLFRDANSEPRQQRRVEAFARATGATQDAVSEALKAVWVEFARHHIEDQRTLSPRDAVRLAAEHLRVALDPDTARDMAHLFATAILDYPAEPIEGALEAVRAAAARGPIAIISDTGVSPGSSLRVLLERHAFIAHFAALVFSDEVGVAKPQPPMFETAARQLGVAPHEVLHIGDLEPTDVAGARSVGARAALFTGDNPRYANQTSADYVFRSWREFVERLPDIAALE